MHPTDLLLSNPPPPAFSEQLRSRTNEILSRIVKTNYNTQFAQTASGLAAFRRVTAGLVDGMDDTVLSETFRKTVHLTTYESYAPFTARFSAKPCKENAIVNLLAPGLPDCLVESSSTSGSLPKKFPKYNILSKIRSSGVASWITADPLRKRTAAYVWHLWFDRMSVEGEDIAPVTTIYLGDASVMSQRTTLYLDPEKDGEKMTTFIFDHAAPFAVGLIRHWHSFLLMHVLFAVGSRALETISVAFLSTFVDMMRFLDMEFDVVVDCIASGSIPNLDGIAEVRQYLEMNISPDPGRAADLRSLGRPSSRPGWCNYAWPNLRSLYACSSGSFAPYVPLARWFLGPNVDMHAQGYGCSEAFIASPYNPPELNQSKLTDALIIEFLDIRKSDSISSLAQVWEVEPGKQYEVVITTQDGLWRYRLGDIIEIAGFDPTDGVPIIQYVERRNVAMQFLDFVVTDKELRTAIMCVVPDILANIVGWTTMVDDRHLPATIGFFVELAGDQVSNPALVAECMLEELTRSNKEIVRALKHELFRKPTIRLVRPGTFNDFRQLRRDEGIRTFGQFKVPVVLSKAAYVTWFADRVVQEL